MTSTIAQPMTTTAERLEAIRLARHNAEQIIAQQLFAVDVISGNVPGMTPAFNHATGDERAPYLADARGLIRRLDPCAMAAADQRAAQMLVRMLGKQWDGMTPGEHAHYRDMASVIAETHRAHLAHGNPDDSELRAFEATHGMPGPRAFTVHEGGLGRTRPLFDGEVDAVLSGYEHRNEGF